MLWLAEYVSYVKWVRRGMLILEFGDACGNITQFKLFFRVGEGKKFIMMIVKFEFIRIHSVFF